MSAPAPSSRRPNRLDREASPYLKQHGHNPVDWYPWGEEALAGSRKRDVPILLSIGYSACHWCHVMERECFEDQAIARLMNERFVCIKVDREERPDLDHVYQLVVQLMGRSGGWPLTVFLTPEQKPFFGGTYFPPTDRYGVPAFPRILEAVSDAYATKRSDVALQAQEICDAIERISAQETTTPAKLTPELLEIAARKLVRRFDDAHGGFGTRPKFPNTMPLEVLLRRAIEDRDTACEARVKRALDAMREGGVYDQLGGGFHRYSTDERWLVPHFEKMLYDNALLLRLYADAYRAFGEDRYARTARETARYVLREMTHAEGGFFATEDADSEGEEGKFFVWSPEEVISAVGGDRDLAELAMDAFGVTAGGNFEHSGKTVLFQARPTGELAVKRGRSPSKVEADLRRAREAMFAARERRTRPFRDEKILASWNGLMIGAMAEAGRALGDEQFVAAAEKAFAFVKRVLVEDGRVQRHVKDGVVKGPGFLDDHSFLASAALDLYEATGEPGYVRDARQIADRMVELFWDEKDSSFFLAPAGGEKLITRAKDPFDQAVPSGASIAALALLRLSELADEKYGPVATKALERAAGPAEENPFAYGQMLCVLDRLIRGSVDIVLVGPRGDAGIRRLAEAVFKTYVPNRTMAWMDPGVAAAREVCGVLAEGKPVKGRPVAYVCRERTCSEPISEEGGLVAAIR